MEKHGFRKKSFGSNTNTKIGPWFRFPIPKPGFSRILGHVCMHVGITLLLVCAFFTVRHEKFAIVVKCRWGKINFEIKPLCHKITIKTEPNIYLGLGFEFEFGSQRITCIQVWNNYFDESF